MQSQQMVTPTSTALVTRAQYFVQTESLLDRWLPGCSARLSRVCCSLAERLPFSVREVLNEALTQDRLANIVDSLLALPQSENQYTRHVLHADPEGRFTVVGLVWAPQQFSPVHAHFTWCAYRVLTGELTETQYTWDSATDTAVSAKTITRRAGQSACGHAGLDFIHRLGNATRTNKAGSEPAVSIHVYGVDADRISSHVNRLLAVNE
jgi:predicted metal-dependent enzyme (double-stranded beta helix superfamily)